MEDFSGGLDYIMPTPTIHFLLRQKGWFSFRLNWILLVCPPTLVR